MCDQGKPDGNLQLKRETLTIVFMDTKKAASPSRIERYGTEQDKRREAIKRERGQFMAALGERCRAARGALEVSHVATVLGVHRNTIWNIERGDSLPDAFELERLATLYKTSAEHLLTGAQVPKGAAEGLKKNTRAVQLGDFIYVPHFDVQASAGPGNLFDQVESVTKMRPFDQSYIAGELGIGHDAIALITVIGSSMEPLLHSRDTVLVDLRSAHEVFNDGIHVIRLDGALLVKQVQRLPGKSFRIRSLNPDYEPFEVRGTEDTERDFAIIGRVRWAGVTIK